jgi:hypothetical protein
VQRADSRIAAVGEDQFACRAHPDHLVVEHVRRHADEFQLCAALAQELMAGREWDQVSEALERDALAICDQISHSVAQAHEFSHVVRYANT